MTAAVVNVGMDLTRNATSTEATPPLSLAQPMSLAQPISLPHECG